MQESIDLVRKMTNSGEEYNDVNIHVAKVREHAIKECRRYNFIVNSENRYEQSILKNLFGHMGENVYIESNFYCEFGFNISMGNNVYINHDMVILDCNEVTLGNQVWVGPKVGLYGANHAEDPIDRANYVVSAKPIIIENGVWLGANVSVLQGVTIGENTIIGAGSVVTKDIPANVVAAGNPCKVIRKLNEKDRSEKNK